MEQLQSERRAGRPKDPRLVKLEEDRRREFAEWESGIGESSRRH